MIISTKERSYLLENRREELLLKYDEEIDIEKAARILDRIEEIEDELERITLEF